MTDPVMVLGGHHVYNDYRDIPSDTLADLALLDSPWNTTGLGFDNDGFDIPEFARFVRARVKPTAWVFVFGTYRMAGIFDALFDYRFEYIWVKPKGAYAPSAVRPARSHEIIWVFSGGARPGSLYFDKEALRTRGEPYERHRDTNQMSEFKKSQGHPVSVHTSNDGWREGKTILEYPVKNMWPVRERTSHPTQKPLDMIRLFVRAYCKKGGIVLDPTLGSGTSLVAADMEGRTCIGAEINPDYQSIIGKRFNSMLHGG